MAQRQVFVDTYKEAFFSRIVSQFLEQYCEMIPGKSVQGRVLFRKFRNYWNEVTHGAKHPALLGQFRVELTQRGYISNNGKWPHWYGLVLRKKKYIKVARKISQEQSIVSSSVDHVHTETPEAYSLPHC
jgi:hypothetical protein